MTVEPGTGGPDPSGDAGETGPIELVLPDPDELQTEDEPVELVLPDPADDLQAENEPPAEPRSEDEAVEAILNGDVPHTVKAEDTWWYEEAPDAAGPEPEPTRDADLLTRTMADLYAEQGLHSEAEAIYSELLAASPDDPDLLERLEAVRETAREREREAPPQESETAPAAPESATLDDQPHAVVPPVGPPAGVPVAEELRQLLRHGEQRARELPDPEEASVDTEEVAEAVGAAEARPPESPASPAGDSEARTESVQPVERDTALGEFAREWLRGLEGGP